MKTLYRITNGIGTYYVVADHPTEAANKLMDVLNQNNYGFFEDRKPKVIEPVAEEIVADHLTNRKLLL